MLVKLYNDSNEVAEFICHSILGRGQFSTAYLATRRSDGLDVILKKLAPRHPSATDSVRFRDAYNLQVELLNKTDNTAAPVIGFYQDENDVPWIALQKMTGDALGKTTFHNLQDLFHVFCGVAKGLGQFHSAGYLMLDLNPNNLFVLSNSGSMEGCYFFDFDAFVSKENLTNLKWIHSTRGFLAPEIKAFQKVTELSEAADIYALGASLYYCLTGAIPNTYTYFACNEEDIREQYKLALTQKVTEKLKAFFYQVLNPLPAERFADWNAVYIALEELSDLADPKNRVKLHSNVILDVGEYYVPTPAQLQQLSDFFLARLGEKTYAVIYSNISGSGKTTLSKAFATSASTHYDSIQFCNYVPKNGWEGILSQISTVNCPKEATDHNEQVVNALRSGHQRTLIIIDNFDQEACHEEMPDWGSETHILFTSRYMADGLKGLDPCEIVDMDCSPELSQKIFTTVYSGLSGKTLTDKQKEIAFQLLRDVDHHSYASDLIARELAQHYPTEEGFVNFADNTHRLWQSKIKSRKDLNVGEATTHKTYQAYIELLFADALSKFTDPVEKTVLSLLSFSRFWDKELFYLLIGDNSEAGRFRGQDAVAKLRERNLLTQTDKDIMVHPLLNQFLCQNSEFASEKFLWLFMGNYYAGFRSKSAPGISYHHWPISFKEKIDSLAKEYRQVFKYGFSSRNLYEPYTSFQGLALVHITIWNPAEWLLEKDGCFDRIPHKRSLQQVLMGPFLRFTKAIPYLNILLGSMRQKNRLMYFFYTPENRKSFPLVAVTSRYLDEECNLSASWDDFEGSQQPIAVEQTMWHNRNMVLPNEIHGKPISDIYEVTWSVTNTLMGTGKYTIKLPSGTKRIHQKAFVCSKIEEIDFPQSLEHIDKYAFAFCTNLKQITLPPNLEVLETGAFDHCLNLEKVLITNPNLKVDKYAFFGCKEVRTITAPKEWKTANPSAEITVDG